MNQDHDFQTQPLDYEPAYLNSYKFRDQYAPMKVGQWLVAILACLIPGVNLLLILFWAFSASINKNLQNFSRAVLIILVVLSLILGVTAILFNVMGKSFIF